MGSVFSGRRRCHLLSGLPGRVDQVRIAQSPSETRSAFGQQRPWPSATVGWGRLAALLWRYLHLLRARFAPSPLDRKSTRLNSSHANISYAVFCLKKKKNTTYTDITHNTTHYKKS